MSRLVRRDHSGRALRTLSNLVFDTEDLVGSETRSRFKEAKILLVAQLSPPSSCSNHCCSQEENFWHHDRMDCRAAALASEVTVRKDGCVRHSTDASAVAISEEMPEIQSKLKGK